MINNIVDTSDIAQELKELYRNKVFREGKYGKTVEIQNAHFLADKDWIIREPNYDYAKREIQWYESQSLYVKDIPGKVPKIWLACADRDGKINSNYGWCVFSDENYRQFYNCVDKLLYDNHTREACMIYNRPSMQYDCTYHGMHDFMCTYATQVFLNEVRDDDKTYQLDYTVFMRSNDAVFGYDNDVLWHRHVQSKMVDELNRYNLNVIKGDIIWNAASLHVYERHFCWLED
jgi:thymidylate synthase